MEKVHQNPHPPPQDLHIHIPTDSTQIFFFGPASVCLIKLSIDTAASINHIMLQSLSQVTMSNADTLMPLQIL